MILLTAAPVLAVAVDASDANVPPTLAPIGSKTVTKPAALSFTAAASDSNPEDPLVFSLEGAPASAAITPDGVFTWTPSATQGPGLYRVTVVVSDGDATDDEVVAITVRSVESVEGPNRYATAIASSERAFPTGSAYVLIATGMNWPDALGGSALAGAVDAPILLTRPDVLPDDVRAEIVRLKGTRASLSAIVLGGTSAVSDNVESSLKTLLGSTNVERIAGPNRYDTADAVAARTIAVLGSAYDGKAFVATGVNFPDALGASPLASAKGWPIYLANPNQGDNAGLIATMKAAGVTSAVCLGGTNVVASSVETSLETKLGPAGDVERLQGANRYDTAIAVAAYGVANAGLSWNRVAIATGQDFPDALAGGVLQGKGDSVLLLTPTASLHPGVRSVLMANESSIYEVRFLGSTGAVSTAVRAAARDAVKAEFAMVGIFVDAGHGGRDPGAVDGTADDGLYTEEANVNLGVALRLRAALVRCGFAIEMSRTDDTYPSLTSRAAAANAWGADALVSIHANAVSGTAKGIEMFYRTSEGQKLAEAIYPFLSAITPWGDRGVAYRGDLNMLNLPLMPSVLIEYGFLTNPAEEALLANPDYQTKLAEATCMGICERFSVPYLP